MLGPGQQLRFLPTCVEVELVLLLSCGLLTSWSVSALAWEIVVGKSREGGA